MDERRESQTISLSPALSITSQSSENSLGSVGYKTALTQLRDTLRPLTSLLTTGHRCQDCDVVLLRPSSIFFADIVPPYLQELLDSTPCKLDYVLLPYCGSCGERIGVPDQGRTWFRTAIDCCKDARLRGLLNVLSDLDVTDSSHPRVAALLRIINGSFVNSRQPVHSLTGPIIKRSKLFKLMDEMFHTFMLEDVPLDSDSWWVYEQMTFTRDSQLKVLIQMDTYIFHHNADRTRQWIRDGLQEDWDHGLPTLKYQGHSMGGARESPYKRATMAILRAIQTEWKGQ
ncbi:hypothetical protein DFS33DRAFT_1274936 [Desarmillaria ectypa]|nr:hypothetical protein DFS33DRAFT_1274936 [Desarmillaria ectypa]